MTREYIRYHERKDNHRCVKCNRELDDDSTMCEECREYHRAHRNDRKQMRKMLGLCSYCGKNKAEPNASMCLECREKERTYYHESGASEKRRERQKEHDANRYQYRKENGLCTACGKAPQQHGMLCNKCLIKRNVNAQRRREERGVLERQSWYMIGKCYTCGGKCINGEKICAKCNQSLADKRTIALDVLKSKEHKDKMHSIYDGRPL